MKISKSYNYIIIGSGLAGSQLAIAFAKNPYFNNKKIAIIDKSLKTENDKTWSFWEKEIGQWDNIIKKKWDQALIFTSNKQHTIALKPYKYKSIESLSFYNEFKKITSKKTNITFLNEQVTSTINNNTVLVNTINNCYEANHVFDSRIPEQFFLKQNKYPSIIQHFKGWVIETKTSTFNPNQFTMMDYRLKDGKQTAFTYVLPFTKNKALVEFTYFTEHIVDEATYDCFIKEYILDILKIENYKITETEKGNIPMTVFPFKDFSTKNITKIGTAGGWVKGSTGYSFKHTEKKVAKIIENLKANRNPSENLFQKKYKFYDKIFLTVLKDENHKGEWVFKQFYSKNSSEIMFKFLDEESSFFQDIKIMKSLFSFSFIKAFFKTLFV